MTIPSATLHNDLYALRGVALLAIVAQYGSLPFFDSGWPVQDEQRSLWYFMPYIVGNGFLPQTFCLASGFFMAKLWRELGWQAALRHRLLYMILPLLLATITIVPLANHFFMRAAKSLAYQDAAGSYLCQSPPEDIWCAARTGNVAEISKHLDAGVNIDRPDPHHGLTPLTWATVEGKAKAVSYLLKRGADVNGRNSNGSTALHEAATMGQDQAVDLLIQRGINTVATDDNGETPLDRVYSGWKHLHPNMKKWQLVADLRRSHWGWMNIAKSLIHPEETTAQHSKTDLANEDSYTENYVWHILTKKEILQHIGFLWIVCLLIPLFVFCAVIAPRLPRKVKIARLVLSPYRYMWLIPLTMIPQWFMTAEGVIAGFGPDHSASLLPPTRLIFYYGIFFFFGVLYHNCHDNRVKLGKHWVVALLTALLLVFPLGVAISLLRFVLPIPGFGFHLSAMQYLLAVALQATFTWVMIAGMMGLFRRIITYKSIVWKYISDNSYWLFIFHPPLLMIIQGAIKTWRLPADVKYIMTLIVVIGGMLITYEAITRLTPLKKLTNTH